MVVMTSRKMHMAISIDLLHTGKSTKGFLGLLNRVLAFVRFFC